MVLKKIELHGFKSFAKKTILEFSHSVSAIVGPNGSGKSNIVEAIKWVTGDQSFKGLRIKKGEELLFRGHSGNNVNSAAVTIALQTDSIKRRLENTPLSKILAGREETIISRLIQKDGINKYFLNDSEARLKDISEILSLMNIGTSRHCIIGQGATDKILYASPTERKIMIEEALGLSIYNFKISEFGRKIKQTQENIIKIEALKNEINPHLKFLQNQVKKFDKTDALKEELKIKCAVYFPTESAFLKKIRDEALTKKEEPLEKLKNFQKELNEIEESGRKQTFIGISNEALALIKNELEICGKKILENERRLGKIEGMLQAKKENLAAPKPDFNASKIITIESGSLKSFHGGLISKINEISAATELNKILSLLKQVKKQVETFFSPLFRTSDIGCQISDNAAQNVVEKLIEEKEIMEKQIQELKMEEETLKKQEKEEKIKIEKQNKQIGESQNRRIFLEKEINNQKEILRQIEIEEVKINIRMSDLEKEKNETFRFLRQNDLDGIANQKDIDFESYNENNSLKTREDIRKIRFKIEEAGDKDPEIMKEYEILKHRDDFFEKELSDLKESLFSLAKLCGDLKQKIQNEFKNGLKKINDEFQKSFEKIFNGGKAALKLTSLKNLVSPETDLSAESGDGETGDGTSRQEKLEELEISINLPRKRVHSIETLSGGEKSLTAIALIFAVSSVNPPPFLILDETDAALDEANSKKYGALLQELSAKTQLIVVTHNRETMRQAGVLYGVTLGRDGASQLLSVKLEDSTSQKL